MVNNIFNKKIAILGFGLENQSLLKYFIKHNAKNITICDKNKNIKKKEKKNIKWNLGDNYLKKIDNFDIIFRTPGIPYLTKEILKAQKKDVKISSQIKYFFDKCLAKIIGVTGTKGKGTTSTLIYQILKKSLSKKSKIYLAGNIGKAPIDFLDKLTKNDWVVLELSSFQLQDLKKSPHIAVVLNITSDHLDYHKDTSEYVEAKTNIVRYQKKEDFTVINLDYLTSFRFAAISPGENDYYFSVKKSVDLGAFVKWNKGKDSSKWGELIIRTKKKDFSITKTYNIPIVGMHNLENILAASMASYLVGAKIKNIKSVIEKFKGLTYRIEPIKNKFGVTYYNDSASTNPDTTIAAIKSFEKPIILIAGGSDKGANYDSLGKEISKRKIKKVILLGKTAQKIKKSILKYKKNKDLSILIVKDLKEAVLKAKKEAKKDDVVLFSPASASFDMFRNYKQRGEQFNKIIKLF